MQVWNFPVIAILLSIFLRASQAQSRPQDPCSALGCLNGGTCALTPLSASAYCQCVPEYTGPRCELRRNVMNRQAVLFTATQLRAPTAISTPVGATSFPDMTVTVAPTNLPTIPPSLPPQNIPTIPPYIPPATPPVIPPTIPPTSFPTIPPYVLPVIPPKNPPTPPPKNPPVIPPSIPPVSPMFPPKVLPVIPPQVSQTFTTQQQMRPNLLNVFFAASLANNFSFYRKLLASSRAAKNLNSFSPTVANGPRPLNPFTSPASPPLSAQNNVAGMATPPLSAQYNVAGMATPPLSAQNSVAAMLMASPRRRGGTDPVPPTSAPPNTTAPPPPTTTPPIPPANQTTTPTTPPTFPATVPPTFPTVPPTVPPTFPTVAPTVPPIVPPFIPPVIPPFPQRVPRFPVVLPLPKPILNSTTPPPVTSTGPCGQLRCPLGSVCRLVVKPVLRTTTAQCVDSFRLTPGVDIDCNNQMYLMALLVPSTTISGFEPMECKNPSFYSTCPAGSTCVANSRTGRFTCCTGSPDGQAALTFSSRVETKMIHKAGTCPAGNTFVCGGTPCKTDYHCEGIQKCCDGCGKFCTNPVVVPPADGCGGCPYRHSCIPQPASNCPPGQPCVRSLHLPTCVPNECLACRSDQFCRKLGTVCSEEQQQEQTEGAGSSLLQSVLFSAYPQLRQLQQPPPCRDLYQCAPKDSCGGCPLGQLCEMTGIVCAQGPCTASSRCVSPRARSVLGADPCGGCGEGYQCTSLGTAAVCPSLPCRTHACIAIATMD